MQTFMGRRVLLNTILTKPGPNRIVRRTAKERLFTRPWKPLQATRVESTQVHSREILMMGGNVLVMHPAMWEEIQRALPQAIP